MAHKIKESRKKKERKKNTLSCLHPHVVLQQGQHPSPQSPEYQAPIPGLDAKRITLELLPKDRNFCCCFT
jgi:hypothetical protein